MIQNALKIKPTSRIEKINVFVKSKFIFAFYLLTYVLQEFSLRLWLFSLNELAYAIRWVIELKWRKSYSWDDFDELHTNITSSSIISFPSSLKAFRVIFTYFWRHKSFFPAGSLPPLLQGSFLVLEIIIFIFEKLKKSWNLWKNPKSFQLGISNNRGFGTTG